MIRYAPDRGYYGPDEFTYHIVDACGNVSNVATVYLEVVQQTKVEDVYTTTTTCTPPPVQFQVSATDMWINAANPSEIPFTFSIFSPPVHGVILGNLSHITYAEHGKTTKQIESVSITLTYVPTAGFTGRDTATIRFSDPFGGHW